MKGKGSSSLDFEYAEVSGDISCPFCKVLLFASLEARGAHEGSLEDGEDGGALICDHVGFWSFGRIDEPHINERWRKEMFLLAKALKSDADNGGENGYHWQELLNFAVDEDGNIGPACVSAIPTLQVVLCKHFSYGPGYPPDWKQMNYSAILLRKKEAARHVRTLKRL